MQTKEEKRPVAVVRPFSINKKQMCSNCEHWEIISGMLGLCNWCSEEYYRKYEQTSLTELPSERMPSPVAIRGGVSQQEQEETQVFPSTSSQSQHAEYESPPLSQVAPTPPLFVDNDHDMGMVFSQEGQRWIFNDQDEVMNIEHSQEGQQWTFDDDDDMGEFSQEGQRWIFNDELLDEFSQTIQHGWVFSQDDINI